MRKWINLFEYADPENRQNQTFYQGAAHYAPKSLWERPGFAEWFEGSKVCAPNGTPLMAFHGSFESFAEFKLDSENRRSYGFNRLGYWFDIDPRTPEYFAGYGDEHFMTRETAKGGSVMPCVLSIKKPLHLDSEFVYGNDDEESRNVKSDRIDAWDNLMNLLPKRAKSSAAEVDAFRNQLISEGYDGIYLGDTAADFGTRNYVGTDWWIAFHPNQIKSIMAPKFSNSNDIMS